MLLWVGGSVSAAAALTAAYAWSRNSSKRSRHYHELADKRVDFIRGREPVVAQLTPSVELKNEFAAKAIVRIDSFLESASLDRLRTEALAASDKKIRNFVPTHKKGGTVSYEQLHRSCPGCLAFYHSSAVQKWVSELVGMTVGPAGDHDQSANSLLFYDEAGDHINWHYDHNFYPGRQFTALINLVNQAKDGSMTASRLVYKDAAGQEVEVDTSANSFVVFEGAKVLHKATPVVDGDLRVMLSMTFNTNAKITVVGEAMRRVKDTAFYGVRALWG
jgi:2OG-Fe(II) oxygenase superfamily